MSAIIAGAINRRGVGDVTAANAEVTAICEQFNTGPVPVTHFARDGFFDPIANDRGVDEKSLDDHYVAAFTPSIYGFGVTLLPVSPFLDLIERTLNYEDTMLTRCTWQWIFTYPSINRRYAFQDGVLINAPDAPAIAERISNVTLQFRFGRVQRGQAYGDRVNQFNT